MKEDREKYPILNMLYLGISVVAIAVVLLQKDTGVYRDLAVLPLIFGMMCGISVWMRSDFLGSWAALILSGGYLIRMAVTPMLFALCGYQTFFYTVEMTRAVMTKSILMMSMECIVVLSVCMFFGKKYRAEPRAIDYEGYTDSAVLRVVGILGICLVAAMLLVPVLIELYRPFFMVSLSESIDIIWDNDTIIPRGTIQRYIYTLFVFTWPVVRMLLPAALIWASVKKFGTSGKSLFLSLLSLLTPFLLLSGDSMGPILASGLGLIMIIRIYGKKAEKPFLCVLGAAAAAVAALVVAKGLSWSGWKGTRGLAIPAQLFQAYLPGFDNTALMLMIENPHKLETLFFDVYYAVPFKTTLFGFEGTYLQDLFTQVSQTGAQIMPFTAQVGHYTTPFLAPFVTGAMAWLAIWTEHRMKTTERYWNAYLLIVISVITAMSVHMYSASIYLDYAVSSFLCVFLVTSFSRPKKKSENDLRNMDA